MAGCTLLLLLCAGLGAATAQAASPGAVVAWGYNGSGQTTVPVVAQTGVMAIAAGDYHTVALLDGPVFLIAKRSGNQLVVSWSASASGLILQSSLNLTPPAIWVDVTNAPLLLGAQRVVTNTFSGSGQFYRLRKP